MNKIYIRYGLVIALLLIAYFLGVRLLDAHENPWLRLLNGLIVSYGIYTAIKKTKAFQQKQFNYYIGFRAGLYTGCIGTIVFVLFMAIYMFHLDPGFPESILDSWMKNYYQGPGILIFVIAVEGFASTLVLSLTFMQKFKPSRNISKKVPQKE